MERYPQTRVTPDAGFVLVEALVAVALVGVCAAAVMAAALSVTHAASRTAPTAALTLTAQNVLTDLRAATAYDPHQLAALAERTASFDVEEPAPNGAPHLVHIQAGVTRSQTTGAFRALVTARAANGITVTIGATLVQEAPAPGSIVPASTPPPCDISPAGCGTEPSAIPL